MKNYFAIFAVSLLFTNSVILAQPAKNTQVKQCDAQMARLLVEQQAIESGSTTETDKRINVLLRVADYLWDKEPDSSRKYYAEAFKAAQERFKEKGIVNTSTTRFYYEPEPDYRFEVIRTIARRDAEWARTLTEEVLKSFDEDKEKDKREAYQKEQEIGQSLRLGMMLLDSNPEAAAAIFRRMMNYPLNRHWFAVLYQMQLSGKHLPLAEQIYAELLARHSNSPVHRLLTLSAFPFGKNQIIDINSFSTGLNPLNVPANINLQRQFLRVLLSRINSLTAENMTISEVGKISDAGYASVALAEFTPIINRNFPELRNDLVRATAHTNSLINEEIRKTLESGKDFKEKSGQPFADKIKALEEADAKGVLSDFEIVKLILDIKTEAEADQLETWLDKIKDAAVREKSINFFYFTSAKIAVKEQRFTEARKLADKVPQIEHRAVLYFDIADAKLKEPMTKFESLEILTEVYKTAEKAPDSVEKAQVLLGVAFMFEKIDRFNSIDTLSKAINAANKLESPNLFTSIVRHQIVGENFGVFSNYSVPGFDINRTFEQISKKDFQGAVSQAESFSDRYLRTLAILATVKDCEKSIRIKCQRRKKINSPGADH